MHREEEMDDEISEKVTKRRIRRLCTPHRYVGMVSAGGQLDNHLHKLILS